MPSAGDRSEETGSWFDSLVPQRLALTALSVSVRAPPTIPLGESRSFYVVVKNRLPLPVTVSTPTSRLWGWEVDGVEEADRRSFSPPETGRSARFSGLERRVFEGSWDGRICEPDDSGVVWTGQPGTHTLTGYFAVEDWAERGLFDEVEVEVTD